MDAVLQECGLQVTLANTYIQAQEYTPEMGTKPGNLPSSQKSRDDNANTHQILGRGHTARNGTNLI
jgi:hypothetical protein